MPALKQGSVPMRRFLPTVLAAVLSIPLAGIAAVRADGERRPDPGFRYEVTGVDAGDVLNVREQPFADAPVVATLAPDAREIVVTGMYADENGTAWWRIVADGKLGWSNARYLAEAAGDGPGEGSYPLTCVGTEPFWSIDAVPDGVAALSSPEGKGPEWSVGPMVPAVPTRGMYSLRLAAGDDVGHIAVMQVGEACSDGMSDFAFPFHGLVSAPDGTVLAGCCYRAR